MGCPLIQYQARYTGELTILVKHDARVLTLARTGLPLSKRKLGASVKAGAKGTPVVYWSINKKESKDSTGETVTSAYAFIKHYYVFNAASNVMI
jgi:antirestriction protein ArdC